MSLTTAPRCSYHPWQGWRFAIPEHILECNLCVGLPGLPGHEQRAAGIQLDCPLRVRLREAEGGAYNRSLTESQLSEVATQIRDYFNSDEELLDVSVTVNGDTKPLFNEREIVHMKDVKELLHAVYRVQEGTFLYLFTFSTVGFLILGNEFAGRMRSLFLRGTVFIYGTVGVVGLVSLVGFSGLFRLFHEVSFSNDFWLLDPRTSFLVRLFPQGFWLESTLLIGMVTLLESGGIVALLGLIGWWQRRRARIAASKQPQFL